MDIVEVDGRKIALSNLDKLLWKREGITKADVIQYYCLSPLDRYCHNCPRSSMEEMTGPSGSSLSIL